MASCRCCARASTAAARLLSCPSKTPSRRPAVSSLTAGVIPPGPDIHEDLTAFDKRYHLPRVDLTLSRALGYAGDRYLAGPEEVLDAEMVHAIAPGAKININFSGPRLSLPVYLGRAAGPPLGAGTSSRTAMTDARTASAPGSCARLTARCATGATGTSPVRRRR